MPGIPGQIIGELGELGKKVGGEAAKVPTDIAGKALESLGVTSGKKQQTNPLVKPQGENAPAEEKGAWEKIDTETDEKIKRAIAREALAQLARRAQTKEPSVWERRQQEEKEKEENKVKQAAEAVQMAPIAVPKGKRRGDFYGLGAKQSSEKSRNVRQD